MHVPDFILNRWTKSWAWAYRYIASPGRRPTWGKLWAARVCTLGAIQTFQWLGCFKSPKCVIRATAERLSSVEVSLGFLRFQQRREESRKMGHSNVWNSHPKNYGPGSRTWFVVTFYSVWLLRKESMKS